MEKETYKLVGIFNMFGVIPDFVWPIFEREGKYFFQDAKEDGYYTREESIKDFIEIQENVLNRIELFKDFSVSGNIGDEYYIGSETVYVFQVNDTELHIGTEQEMIDFVKMYTGNDECILEILNDFLREADIDED